MDNAIKSVDFHCQSNNKAHRTIEITTKQLIVRRGQDFLMTLNMMRPFRNNDPLILIMETGAYPSETRGTRSEFGNPSPMYASDVKAIWKYTTDWRSNLPQGAVTLSVTPPADAPVGKYSVSATVGMEKTDLGSLVVLFNPWCSDDWVYLPDERERQEYVMNEQGIIYISPKDWPASRDWVFGQFEEDMVDICLKLLDVNAKHLRDPADDVSARCNPIYVSRVISAMINSNDDRGVLTGKWGRDFSGGERPTSWLGSLRILRKWYKANCHPVKYGQCWVFAGVMCTVMRFFGIPCRVVTNFESAHDNDGSLTITEYYNERGILSEKEKIWNFHVWVEGWMKRPDLKKGDKYDGWQVLDPTPQEISDGQYCCGPAPVAAILHGDMDLKYDVPFVYAEVNADLVKWMVAADGSKRKMNSDTSVVGQNISTKVVGKNMRDDVTKYYKHREGSMSEREVFRHAVHRLNPGDDAGGSVENEPQRLEIKLEKVSSLLCGQDINLRLKLLNKERTSRTMNIYVNAQGMRYTGIPVCHILNTKEMRTLPSGQDVIIPIRIPFQAYRDYMANCNNMKVSVVAEDDRDIYESELDISLQYPSIAIKVVGEARLYHMLTLVVEFTNTFDIPLKNCSLTITGSGMYKFGKVGCYLPELEPSATWKVTTTTTPSKLGARLVVADFDCSAFRDVLSSCFVDVKP